MLILFANNITKNMNNKYLRKDNGKTADQNRECNYEKWKNLNLIIFHKFINKTYFKKFPDKT